jgi:hypothetical protein
LANKALTRLVLPAPEGADMVNRQRLFMDFPR